MQPRPRRDRCRTSRGVSRCRCATARAAGRTRRREPPRKAGPQRALGRRWWRRPRAVVGEEGSLRIAGHYRKGNPTNGERDSGLEQRVGPSYPALQTGAWERVDISTTMAMSRIRRSTACCRVSAERPADQDHADADRARVMYQARNTWARHPGGRPSADPVNSRNQTFMGDSIGRWEA